MHTHHKILVIGSGPIVIGQAAEFDYAGTQACRVLQNEGKEVILVNSNPATIMTDANIASRTYLEPLTLETLKKIIIKEKPDSLLGNLGGQTALNLAVELSESGFLAEHNVDLLGVTVDVIKKAEDRQLFKNTMEEIGEPVIESKVVSKVDQALKFAKQIGYPLIIRPAYTMGGAGGGTAHNDQELSKIVDLGLKASRNRQVLVEKSVAGWQEIEYEVIRDATGDKIIVCNMENLDPVGVHTGDSVVVAPVQTLSVATEQKLRHSALKIADALGIIGGCNVQYALHPSGDDYCLIEVNPRVSRSSALASKATGYPIAKVTALLSLGYTLDDIRTGHTKAGFFCDEPTVDYVVLKFPRFPFDKFTTADRLLGTKMKATGEVMSISNNFAGAFMKAVRSLEIGYDSLDIAKFNQLNKKELLEQIAIQSDERFFAIATALRAGITVCEIHGITKITAWFLEQIKTIVDLEEEIKKTGQKFLTPKNLWQAKQMGIGDTALSKWCHLPEDEIFQLRYQNKIIPAYQSVDTCKNLNGVPNAYYYSVYNEKIKNVNIKKEKNNTIVVIGSGPIRIGQGIEFDYCSVHAVWALKDKGYDVVMINNNPETVSTDFDIADRLYFEPLTSEEVLEVLAKEKPVGVIVQFGGETAIKLAETIDCHGYKILGTSCAAIDAAEDRQQFENLLGELDLNRPIGKTTTQKNQVLPIAQELTYPVLVRPSYVLGGQGMKIANDDDELIDFIANLNVDIKKHPLLIDKYISGKELEVDAICDGKDVLIPGIMEHLERAGVHSGDSISLYPSQSLFENEKDELVDIVKKLALASRTIGLINIQFILSNDKFYIIEINPRSSRTVPFLSKVTGVPMVNLAVRVALGEKIKDFGFGTDLYESRKNIFAVKVPIFSNEKIPKLEVSLSPEMQSTGEVLGLSKNYRESLMKGLVASGISFERLPEKDAIFITVANQAKEEALEIAQTFYQLGYEIYSTTGTAKFLTKHDIPVTTVRKLSENSDDIPRLIKNGTFKYIIIVPTKGRDTQRDGFKIRRLATEQGAVCLTSLDTAKALTEVLKSGRSESKLSIICLQDVVK